MYFSTSPIHESELTAIGDLLIEIEALRQSILETGAQSFEPWRPFIQRRRFLPGAVNLAHYIAMRRYDLRPLQQQLMIKGLSSLGRSESRVLPSLDAVITTLHRIYAPHQLPPRYPPARAYTRGQRLLRKNATELFGPEPSQREGRIMVTLPSVELSSIELIEKMLCNGMNIARINCAHDGPDQWAAVIDMIRAAEANTGHSCRILMDLGGPKIRTANIYQPLKAKHLHIGDDLILTSDIGALQDSQMIKVSCTYPEIINQLQVGDKVWFDDGKLGMIVTARLPSGVRLQVTQARAKGVKLKSAKGLNFPDTEINMPSLTAKDIQDLAFVIDHADLVGYSFVQTAFDMDNLVEEIQYRTNRKIGIVAKIETPLAVRNLPEIIVHAAGRLPLGLMIARGDLALELGFERMAEMQEELLWLSEAASIPVIWATQVLENLAKTGVPSRAEMTDAAMAERAECVMLNKGPFIPEAITTLDNILTRMSRHQDKKTAQLRALRSW